MSEPLATDEPLDEPFRSHATRAFGFDDEPETFGALWANIVGTFADALDRHVTVDDLCTTDISPHWATVNGRKQHYQCVTDAFILGAFLDDSVTARTESPVSGTELLVEFDAAGVVDAPDGAYLSVGVERGVTAPDGPVTPGKMYERFCPYSNAFASREEYEEWDAAHPDVVSTALPLGDALALQVDLLGDGGTGTEDALGAESSGGGCSCC